MRSDGRSGIIAGLATQQWGFGPSASQTNTVCVCLMTSNIASQNSGKYSYEGGRFAAKLKILG